MPDNTGICVSIVREIDGDSIKTTFFRQPTQTWQPLQTISESSSSSICFSLSLFRSPAKSTFFSSMSGRLSIGKKLRPARKALKSFTSTMHSKLKKLKKQATRCFHSLWFLFSSKRRRSITSSHDHHGRNRFDLTQFDMNFAAIHIDELFVNPAMMTDKIVNAEAESSRYNEVEEERMARKKTDIYSVEDAWKMVVDSSPHLRGVDERAEDFISKFRRDMRLEKERSLNEFQEMLARGS